MDWVRAKVGTKRTSWFFVKSLGFGILLPGLHTRRSPLTHLGVPPPGEIWYLGEEAEVRCAVLASWCFLSRWYRASCYFKGPIRASFYWRPLHTRSPGVNHTKGNLIGYLKSYLAPSKRNRSSRMNSSRGVFVGRGEGRRRRKRQLRS